MLRLPIMPIPLHSVMSHLGQAEVKFAVCAGSEVELRDAAAVLLQDLTSIGGWPVHCVMPPTAPRG